MVRRWSINGRFLTQPMTGVQRYACEIVRELDALLDADHPFARMFELELVSPKTSKGQSIDLALRHIPTRVVGGARGHAWEQLLLPQNVSGGLISLCNTGPLVHPKHIVCIHDLNTRLYPASYSWKFAALYRALLPALGLRAKAVTTVSRFSADQLVGHGVCAREKIAIVPDGHEHALRWSARHSQRTGRDTVVLIGSLAPHKNVALILGLARRLAEAGLRIAVSGTRDDRVFNADGAAVPAADNIIWLGRLSDDELAGVLTDCLCLAFPSFTEGFGLPPLEAMALGCPVVASDQASLPEICGEAALYAAPTNADAWMRQLVRISRNERLRARLADSGRLRAKRFSWRRSAELYLELMGRIDGISQSSQRQAKISGAPRPAA
jgi:glycosyltransferase involved in cell wall biosynthesis